MVKYNIIIYFVVIFFAQNAFAAIKYQYGSPKVVATATATIVSVSTGLLSEDNIDNNSIDITDDLVGGSFVISTKNTPKLVDKLEIIYKILSQPNSTVNIQYRTNSDINNSGINYSNNNTFFYLKNNFGDIIKVELGTNQNNNIIFGKNSVSEFVINPQFLIDPKKSRGNFRADYYLVASY